METILIVGGGITGLSVVYTLEKEAAKQKRDLKLLLVDSATQLGGKIRTVKENGFIMETGADSIVARKMKDSGLIEELELEEEAVYNAVGTSFLFREGELKQIPQDSVFGIPASIQSLAESPLLSDHGKVEALKDFYINDRKFSEHDSIGEFLEYYLGKELVEKQIAPVLSGVYSGTLHNLTIASTLPYVLEYKEKYGSIMKGFATNKNQFLGKDDKKFLSFNNGLSTIIDAMANRLEKTEIWLEHEVEQINKTDGKGYKVYFTNGKVVEADSIVLSIPHNHASRLFSDKELHEEFSKIKTSSLISVYVGYSVSDGVLPENGTGYIAPDNDLFCNACTWTSRKWEHTSKGGNLLIRLFYKSSHPRFSEIKDLNDKDLLKIAKADIEKSLHINAEPVVSTVTKWTDQMPTYQITHPDTVSSLEEQFAQKYPDIFLAGCSYYGVGIPDCIENGKEIAKKISEKVLLK